MYRENERGLSLPKKIVYQPASAAQSNVDLIEDFLSWKRSYTKWAFDRYRIWVTRFQEFVDRPPELLIAADYVRFVDWMKERYSDRNIQFGQNIVHNYLRYFFEQGRLGFPMFMVRVSRVRTESHYCIREDEYEAMVALLQKQQGAIHRRDECIIRMLHDTGMRLRELTALNLNDVQTDRTARIQTEKTVHERHVFWTADTQRALQRYLAEWREQHGNRFDEGESLFRNSRSPELRLDARSVQRTVKRSSEAARVDQRICPHSFRHAFIHRMARKGVPDSVTSVLVGHSTPATVAQYTKLSSTEQRFFVESKSIKAEEGDRHALETYPHPALAHSGKGR